MMAAGGPAGPGCTRTGRAALDDFVEDSRRVVRLRLTSGELAELHRLGRERASRAQLQAFFQRVVERAAPVRPADPAEAGETGGGAPAPPGVRGRRPEPGR
jgi:hypothetical protein